MSVILGIESSCDETSAAVVRDGRVVLGHVVASQHELHAEYGGVVPEIASRAHLERLLPVLRQAVGEAGVGFEDLDAVAVGNRPGLIGSLLVGVSAAQALAWSLGVPLIGIDHVQAHLYAGHLVDGEEPAAEVMAERTLGLVVSGGHTSLYDVGGPLDAEVIGRTIDDAIGEAYDKAAVILGLGFPGGPAVERCAAGGDADRYALPVSMLGRESLDFSFSGLKTALLYLVRGRPKTVAGKPVFERSSQDLGEQERADLAASFQRAAVHAVTKKIERALDRSAAGYGRLVAGGGVTANRYLRGELASVAERRDLELMIPKMIYCVDNAAMIAGLAHHRFVAGDVDGLDLAAMSTPSGAGKRKKA
ncbi:tRNA (adenosine(37)-N6)-threonylcarbamoyltransferase complex transferase subunit TsaD [Mucisphaera calidilacus]|uniref:tRNA N6-adenosine threonylcarbamoyltransferase n=1 Tax=Mucisphaera calidilacus TaxID=2527982 RepID=A0A518BXB5_9BACT|nr:tRNA (adenosine(37)-N6)-threonylcarbamoyltransferase complex transferase subunit TsaD [Mucisphaera calidilacus]QDU71605.1 tRNA N6-adenosine threonylcarbamoyltransferase [Mucisphaera calidilacus]